MLKKHELIHSIIQNTRSKKIIWYKEHESKDSVIYVSEFYYTNNKKIVMRLSADLGIQQFYLSIKNVNKNFVSDTIRLFSNEMEDLDMVYYSIKYKNPEELPEDKIIF